TPGSTPRLNPSPEPSTTSPRAITAPIKRARVGMPARAWEAPTAPRYKVPCPERPRRQKSKLATRTQPARQVLAWLRRAGGVQHAPCPHNWIGKKHGNPLGTLECESQAPTLAAPSPIEPPVTPLRDSQRSQRS